MERTPNLPAAASLTAFALSLPLRALAALPQSARLGLGRFVGRSVGRWLRKRRAVMQANLRCAFPAQDDVWRENVLNRHFERLGEDALESIWGWYGRTDTPPPHTVIGAEHIEAALARDQGVILNAGHFTQGEISVYLAARRWPVHAVYRPNDNPAIDELINRGRRRHLAGMIDRENTRGMIRTLRQGGIIWTAADQSYHGRQSAFIPFFGTRCATNIAVPVLARMGNAVVLPYYVRRTAGEYTVIIQPPLEGLPSGDDAADTARLVERLEAEIRQEPSGYLWGHRRYKDVAPGEASPYESGKKP
ncbi:hypothetical protein A9404_09925 [Halothiobacillus diazotrophicus]|uniref:Lipid A biosynthesis lauroyl acyltransferase n=1 Tax=Halothiobacillus diazotrophicus TaxID=1860122 RepID=A0A191ZIG1_9GAMM|nr:lysophospholipid acyltransferase family protein [Halothiobacillus diazotrophicus]ANJ67655.1 hypothetical protein A9404_09925 [Halothiobacillus diazotrophicus]